MRLIGLAGFKGSGKDTVYEIISELEDGVVRIAFADKLKVIAGRALGLKGRDQEIINMMNVAKEAWGFDIYDESLTHPLPQHGITGREYLQFFGHAGRECFGEDFWVNQILPWERYGVNFAGDRKEWLPGWYPKKRIVVVTDVRYANEAARIQFLGGENWWVERPGIESDGHFSEARLGSGYINKTIINNGSLDALRERVKAAL